MSNTDRVWPSMTIVVGVRDQVTKAPSPVSISPGRGAVSVFYISLSRRPPVSCEIAYTDSLSSNLFQINIYNESSRVLKGSFMFQTFAAIYVCSFPIPSLGHAQFTGVLGTYAITWLLKLVDWGPEVMSTSPSPNWFYSWKCRGSADRASGNNCSLVTRESSFHSQTFP